MTDVVIVDAVRTPMGRSKNGVFRNVRAEVLSAEVMRALMARNPAVKPEMIEDVIWGCVTQTLEQGFNIARMAVLIAGLPHEVPAQTVNRLCGSSMTALHTAVGQIHAGSDGIYIVGGVEHMGHVPMTTGASPAPELSLHVAQGAFSMGLTAEMLAGMYKISRQEQDQFAVGSHQRAYKARVDGELEGEMIPVPGHDADGLPILVDFDEVVRPETTMETLASLKPAFMPKGGSVTAGNSSAISDGAAGLLVMSASMAATLGLKPMARVVSIAAAGCDPSIMGIGPVPASKKALARAGLGLKQIDFFELNEAFAAQSLAVLTQMNLLDRLDHVNVKGGAIALGHPLGCSGARILGSLAHTLQKREAQYGLATMCIGMGQGTTTVLERVA